MMVKGGAFTEVDGFAAMLHGSTLLTRDLDVCAVLSSANVEKLRRHSATCGQRIASHLRGSPSSTTRLLALR